MNSFFIKIVAIFIVFIGPIFGIFTQTSFASQSSLSIVSVKAIGEKYIEVTFNQPILLSSLRVLVEDQITRDIIPVESYKEGKSNEIIQLLLTSKMELSRTYKMTVSTATSLTGETISAGIDAVREFVTPILFDEFIEEQQSLSAAVNTGAVSSKKEEINEDRNLDNQSIKITSSEAKIQEKEINKDDKISEILPETGVEIYFLCFLAVIFSAILMRKLKRL